MTGIAGAQDQDIGHDALKCAREGCDTYEKRSGCFKVARAVPGKGVVQWCTRACYDADFPNG